MESGKPSNGLRFERSGKGKAAIATARQTIKGKEFIIREFLKIVFALKARYWNISWLNDFKIPRIVFSKVSVRSQ